MATDTRKVESPVVKRWREQKEAQERDRRTPIKVEKVYQPR